jgi:hypothetical protein
LNQGLARANLMNIDIRKKGGTTCVYIMKDKTFGTQLNIYYFYLSHQTFTFHTFNSIMQRSSLEIEVEDCA